MNEIKVLSPSSLRPLPGVPSEEGSILFRLGETLRGRVVQQIDPRHAFLKLRGQDLLVESHIPLPPGVDLQFRVEEVQPKVTLRLLPPESPEAGKIYSLLKRALAGDVPLDSLAAGLSILGKGEFQGIPPAARESWEQFLGLLRGFGPSGYFSPDPGALPRLLAQSGFFWESKLIKWFEGKGKDSPARLIQGDMKGLGKMLLGQLKGPADSSGLEAGNPRQVEEWKQGLEPFLQKIELYQLLNLNRSEWPDPFYLFLPFWLGNELQFVQLNLSFPRKKMAAAGRDETSILFLLNLPALGRVRIEARMGGKDLFCRIMLSDPEASEFVHQSLAGLKGRLQQLGYHPYVQLSVEKAEKLEETLVKDVEKGTRNLFNITI